MADMGDDLVFFISIYNPIRKNVAAVYNKQDFI